MEKIHKNQAKTTPKQSNYRWIMLPFEQSSIEADYKESVEQSIQFLLLLNSIDI